MSEETIDPSKPNPEEKTEKPEEKKEESRFSKRISDLSSERDTWKTKAEEYERKEREAAEAEAVKRGDFEKLLTEKETKLAQTEAEAKEAKAKVEAYEASMKAQLDKSLESIKDEKKRAVVEKALAGKPLNDQAALIPELLEAMGSTTGFGNQTPTGDQPPKVTEIKQSRFKELNAKPTLTKEETREFQSLSRELGEEARKREEERRKEYMDKEMDSRSTNYFG